MHGHHGRQDCQNQSFALILQKKNMAAGAAPAKNLPWQLCNLAIVESFDEN